VNLTGGQPQMCIDAYAVLEWENDTKFHVFADMPTLEVSKEGDWEVWSDNDLSGAGQGPCAHFEF
jgi:hypothetical protein